LVRDKANLVAESADWLRRVQKSPDQMNVRVHRAVADMEGTTGMAILRAIARRESGIAGNWRDCATQAAAKARRKSPKN
jgi:hypothetical protein